MAWRRLQPAALPDPVRYSRGWQVGNTVYLSGALGHAPDGTMPSTLQAQARNAFQQLAAVLGEAGGSLRHIVKFTVFVTDMRYLEPFSEVRAELFPGDKPASTLVQCVALADPRGLIEIEGVAVLD